MKNTSDNLPKLQAPGAGLPLLQRIYLRFYAKPILSKKFSLEQTEEEFLKVSNRTLSLIKALPPETLTKRVLVDPIAGLEDSSRYWSLAMTLEHLMIVGNGIIKISTDLSQGIRPQLVAKVENVKPLEIVNAQEHVDKFSLFVSNAFPQIRQNLGDYNHPLTHKHPWFNDFTAKQWIWLLGAHGRIHHQQCKAIAAELR